MVAAWIIGTLAAEVGEAGVDSDGKAGEGKPGSRRRGQARLGTDEEAAAKIRGAIKASLARAHGEWVQLEETDEATAVTPPPEATTTVTVETESPSVGDEIKVHPEPSEREEEAAGRALREARERRQITLDQASSETRIAKRYLAALEEGASPERLPSRAYTRFFLRDYARYLGVDEQELQGAYRAGDEDSDGDLEPISVAGSRPRRRWATAMAVAAVVAGLILLGVTRIGVPQQEPLPTTPRSSPTVGVVTPPVEPTATPAPTRATEIVAVLRASEASWVEAVADGETVLQELLQPDSAHRVRADQTVELLLGNAGGIRLTVNGRRVTTGASGEVARLSFELRDGRVVSE
ncbi:MAG: DUF4115 domain-containing protein [Actinomycetota bacterium]|nr:DUF4115 domain-containing protein [Actinomycetota bacterium]